MRGNFRWQMSRIRRRTRCGGRSPPSNGLGWSPSTRRSRTGRRPAFRREGRYQSQVREWRAERDVRAFRLVPKRSSHRPSQKLSGPELAMAGRSHRRLGGVAGPASGVVDRGGGHAVVPAADSNLPLTRSPETAHPVPSWNGPFAQCPAAQGFLAGSAIGRVPPSPPMPGFSGYPPGCAGVVLIDACRVCRKRSYSAENRWCSSVLGW